MIPAVYDAHVVATNEITKIITKPVPAGYLFVCESIYCYDGVSSIANSITVGIASGYAFIPVDRKEGSISAKVPFVRNGKIWLGPEQSIAAVFDIPTANDDLHLYAHGYLMLAWND